jgi:hypothetical protein
MPTASETGEIADMKSSHLLVSLLGVAFLCGLALSLGGTAPSYAGGPDVTPTCLVCTGGMNPTPVPDKSSIVGYVYDYSSGSPAPRKDVIVKLDGCSWSAQWGTDDFGYFYFNNLGQGAAEVNLQLPPSAHVLNPNVIVQTSGLTETYTVYLGYYVGNTAPTGPLTTPDGKSLTGLNGGTIPLPPPGPTPGAAPLPDVGGTLPDSYLVIGLSAALLVLLPVAGLAKLARFTRKRADYPYIPVRVFHPPVNDHAGRT